MENSTSNKNNFCVIKRHWQKHLVYSNSINKKTMFDDDINKIEELLDSFLQIYYVLPKSIEGNDIVLYFVDGIHYNCHEVSLKLGVSSIKNPE